MDRRVFLSLLAAPFAPKPKAEPNMAFLATLEWDVRTTGNDANGGAFEQTYEWVAADVGGPSVLEMARAAEAYVRTGILTRNEIRELLTLAEIRRSNPCPLLNSGRTSSGRAYLK